MLVNKSTAKLIFGNIELLRFCNDKGISMEKLRGCNIERMGNHYVFLLKKDGIPVSHSALPLDIDLESRPDAVLLLSVGDGDANIQLETTDKTIRVLDI